MTKKENYQENREKIKKLSQTAKALVETGDYSHVNEALVEGIYKEQNPEIEELNTFWQWKDKGYSIIKGEKAFIVWGQPRKVEQDEEQDEFKFWPLCYLFANTQVVKITKKEVA